MPAVSSSPVVSRRRFLQLGLCLSAELAALAALPPPAPAHSQQAGASLAGVSGRVAGPAINIYSEPSFDSRRQAKLVRDQLVLLIEEIRSERGPAHNPLWYRIEEGYIHSGLVQRVDYHPPNPPVKTLPPGGMLAQITAPYTRSFYAPAGQGFQPLYRLYYESAHWVKDVIEDLEGGFWYRLYDPKLEGEYFAPCSALRPILPESYAPISQDVPAAEKRIQVNVEEQTLTAFEGDRTVLVSKVSSGVPNPADLSSDELPTDTPKGFWRITLKMPSRHMGDGRWTSQVDAYELPGVPWTMAFHKDGYALHGSYWHNNFGRRMSHGCINMRNQDALWLFRWSDPPFETTDWYVKGVGTLVQVI